MKIKVRDDLVCREVFSIYYVNSQVYFLFDDIENRKLSPVNSLNVKIVNTELERGFVYWVPCNGFAGVYHESLTDEGLLSNLLECGSDFYNDWKRNLQKNYYDLHGRSQ